MGPISTDSDPDPDPDAFAFACWRLLGPPLHGARELKTGGVLMRGAVAALGAATVTGTGPSISDTWKSTKFCRNHDRRRPMNVGNAGAPPSPVWFWFPSAGHVHMRLKHVYVYVYIMSSAAVNPERWVG